MKTAPCATLVTALLAVVPTGPPTASAQVVKVDEGISEYQTVSGIAGNLSSVGSDTLNNLMTLWAESFRSTYPSVRIQVEGKGSSTAPPALIQSTAQLGPMSRKMKDKEIDAFEQRFGYPPTPIRVAVDALAVYVHKDNPLEQLTLPQVDAIFSKTRRCGGPSPIDLWSEIASAGSMKDVASGGSSWGEKDRPIRLYGRNSASGTYGYFKDVALCRGDYRDTTKEQPGSASVVQGVAEDLYGIGYSGIGYMTSGVKALRLAREEGAAFASTDPAEVYAGRYPLARYLYLYVNKRPNEPLDALTEQFLRFVLSRAGQEIVVKDGYLPLGARIAEAEIAKLR